MGLFDKKFCDICGEKIGMLGNRKLEDGNMCKDCAKKLSPFCDDRRHSTLEQIKAHLRYREENKEVLSSFNPTLVLGENKKFYIDQMKRSFVISKNSPGKLQEENPDVIPIAQIISCTLDIEEDQEEIYMTDSNGEDVSYNPPRYNYTYDFNLRFLLNNPYFDDFKIQLNSFSVEGRGSVEYNRYHQMAMDIMNALGVNGSVNMQGSMGMQNGMNMGMNNMGGMPVNNMGYQQNPYGQQMPQQGMYGQVQGNMYAQQGTYQQNPYGQQMPQQGMYGQVQGNMYAQQGAYQQNPYAQQMPQNNAYAQTSMSGWSCPNCGTVNEGKFCSNCGTPGV